MSIESAKAFIERMKTDKEFASKVTVCANAQERMALVKAAGFDFTAAEMDGVKQELTDSELERVTGGVLHSKLTKEDTPSLPPCFDPGPPRLLTPS